MTYARILSLFLLVLNLPLSAQTYCLRYSIAPLSPTQIAVTVSMAGAADFKLADANLVFNFNNTALSAPSLISAFNNTNYSPITVTNPATGIASINIDFNGALGSALGFPIRTTSTQVAQVQFTVNDASLASDISTHALYSAVYKDTTPYPIYLNLDADCPTSVFEWIDFQALATTDNKGVKSVNLTWVTTANKEAHHFVIERSLDGKTFEKVGVVMPANTPSAKHTSRGVDTQPWSGLTFYRIRAEDKEGNLSFSPIRTVTLTNDITSFSIHPNPKDKESPLSIQTNWTGNYTFNLYDAWGKLVYTQSCKGMAELTNINLAGGFYLYECKTAQERITGKLIVPN
jgi:hypothetical protein